MSTIRHAIAVLGVCIAIAVFIGYISFYHNSNSSNPNFHTDESFQSGIFCLKIFFSFFYEINFYKNFEI